MTVFLIAAALAALWLGSLYVHPFGACPRCRGKRRIWRGQGSRKRPVTCPKCSGVGRGQRPGSRTVHQLARRAGRELARTRNPRRIERTYSDADR